MRRYLAAFGPALPADLATWSRLTGFREVLDRMRPTLRTFRDEHGRELVDVPGAPLPDPDTPAPVRFLPEYDNAVLSHADRSRYVPDDVAALATEGPVHGTVLVDGSIAATWSTGPGRRRGDAHRAPPATVPPRRARDRPPRASGCCGSSTRPPRTHDVRLVAVG